MGAKSLGGISRKNILLICLSAVMIGVPYLLRDYPFYIDVIIKICFYTFLASAWNLTSGYIGMISFMHVALFGIGAYVSTIVQSLYGINVWIGLLIGCAVSVVIGVGFIYPAVRLKGLFLALATLAFTTAVQVIFLNWRIVIYEETWTRYIGGAVGIFVPMVEDSLLAFQWHETKLPYCYLIMGLLVLQLIFMQRLVKSRTGYFFLSIREDEDAASSLGVNTVKYKLIAMAIAAFFSSIAGTFHAQYLLFVEPVSMFNLNFMFEIALLTILGGLGQMYGPLLGSLIYVPLSTQLRVMFGGTTYTGLAQIILGLALIIIMTRIPSGIYGYFEKFVKKI
jgi:branched-chain amino acid transport system permease protein